MHQTGRGHSSSVRDRRTQHPEDGRTPSRRNTVARLTRARPLAHAQNGRTPRTQSAGECPTTRGAVGRPSGRGPHAQHAGHGRSLRAWASWTRCASAWPRLPQGLGRHGEGEGDVRGPGLRSLLRPGLPWLLSGVGGWTDRRRSFVGSPTEGRPYRVLAGWIPAIYRLLAGTGHLCCRRGLVSALDDLVGIPRSRRPDWRALPCVRPAARGGEPLASWRASLGAWSSAVTWVAGPLLGRVGAGLVFRTDQGDVVRCPGCGASSSYGDLPDQAGRVDTVRFGLDTFLVGVVTERFGLPGWA